MSEQQTTEWGLEARWVKLSDREPNHDDEVFARKTAEDFLTVIYFAEEGDIKYSINGESYIFDDQMDQWEWLELRPKELVDPVSRIDYEQIKAHMRKAWDEMDAEAQTLSMPFYGEDGLELLNFTRNQKPENGDDKMNCSEDVAAKIPLPDGRTLEINENDDYFGTCLLLDGEKFIPIFHYNIKCEDIDSQCERYEKTILENMAIKLCNKRLVDKVKMLSGEKDQAVRKRQ